MHPIIFPDKIDRNPSEVSEYIIKICNQHRSENRAMAFAFIISNLHNPHIIKIMNDPDYFNSLDDISGKYLTVFYIYDNFTMNHLILSNGIKKKNNNTLQNNKRIKNFSNELVKNLFDKNSIKSPSVVFFQVNEDIITDHFTINLDSDKIEEGFNELKNIILLAVNSLNKVSLENMNNTNELFALIKQSIKSAIFWKKTRKVIKTIFSLKEFTSLFTG